MEQIKEYSPFTSLGEWREAYPKAYNAAKNKNLIDEACEKFGWIKPGNSSIEDSSLHIGDEERKKSLEILNSPNLMQHIRSLLKTAGVSTENEKAMLLFCLLLSRHTDKPIPVLFQGDRELSRFLMDIIVFTIPLEQFYPSYCDFNKIKVNLDKKVLYLGDRFQYGKKISSGSIAGFMQDKILSKDNLYTESCILMYYDQKNLNRNFLNEFFQIHLDYTDQSQKDRNNYENKKYAGLIHKKDELDAKRILTIIQSLIKPIRVIIPYAMELEEPSNFKGIRNFERFLNLIQTITLLHQFQLEIKTNQYGEQYIESTKEHLQIALSLLKSISNNKSDLLIQGQRNKGNKKL